MTEDNLRVKFLQGQPKELTVDQKFRLVVHILRKYFPTEHPIRVRRLDNEKMACGGYTYKDAPWGYCRLVNEDRPVTAKVKRYFLIQLNNKAVWQTMLETLMHEWAHALTWRSQNTDHGDLFARAYGSIYRTLIED